MSSVKIESLLDEKQYVNVLHFLVFVFAFFVLISFLSGPLWLAYTRVFTFIYFLRGSKGGAVVRTPASHQCGPGSNPGVDAICGLSLLLVLSLAPRGFSPGTLVFPSPQKPTLPNSNSIWNARTLFNEFLRTPKYSVGKQITIFFNLKSLWPATFVENGSPARLQYSHEDYIWISDVIVGSCFVLQTMRVKLQPPSGSELPGYNPILPPSAITQVMLIANPAKVSSVIAKLLSG